MERTYAQLCDEELCRLAEEDSGAEEYLLIKYKRVVLQEARTLFLTWGDRDDLVQEGMIGLYRAIRAFRVEGGASFATFARLCIRRQICNAIQSANRKKNLPMEEYVPLHSPEFRMQEQKSENGFKQRSPEQQMIDREETRQLLKSLKKCLSALEWDVLREYIAGNNYQEIARKLGRTPKSIDNAITRIKGKTRKILEDQKRIS